MATRANVRRRPPADTADAPADGRRRVPPPRTRPRAEDGRLVDPGSTRPAALHQLQRTAGNRTVQRLVTAERSGASGETDPIRGRRSGGGGETGGSERAVPWPGRPLPASVRADAEAYFGRGLGGVRLHTGARATAAADALDARAFTLGSDVVLGSSVPAPESDRGRRLLAHELAHVVQQTAAARHPRSAPSPTPARGRHEREATAVADDFDAPSNGRSGPTQALTPAPLGVARQSADGASSTERERFGALAEEAVGVTIKPEDLASVTRQTDSPRRWERGGASLTLSTEYGWIVQREVPSEFPGSGVLRVTRTMDIRLVTGVTARIVAAGTAHFEATQVPDDLGALVTTPALYVDHRTTTTLTSPVAYADFEGHGPERDQSLADLVARDRLLSFDTTAAERVRALASVAEVLEAKRAVWMRIQRHEAIVDDVVSQLRALGPYPAWADRQPKPLSLAEVELHYLRHLARTARDGYHRSRIEGMRGRLRREYRLAKRRGRAFSVGEAFSITGQFLKGTARGLVSGVVGTIVEVGRTVKDVGGELAESFGEATGLSEFDYRSESVVFRLAQGDIGGADVLAGLGQQVVLVIDRAGAGDFEPLGEFIGPDILLGGLGRLGVFRKARGAEATGAGRHGAVTARSTPKPDVPTPTVPPRRAPDSPLPDAVAAGTTRTLGRGAQRARELGWPDLTPDSGYEWVMGPSGNPYVRRRRGFTGPRRYYDVGRGEFTATPPGRRSTRPELDENALTREQRRAMRRFVGKFPNGFRTAWRNAGNDLSRRRAGEVERLLRRGKRDEAYELARKNYDNYRGRFWRAVRRDEGLKGAIEDAGFRFERAETSAPFLELPGGHREPLTLEHRVRVADDPTHAVDPDNLQLVLLRENTEYLEAIRRHLRRTDPTYDPRE